MPGVLLAVFAVVDHFVSRHRLRDGLALAGAQRRKRYSVLRPEASHDHSGKRNGLPPGQRNLDCHMLPELQRFGDECTNAALAQIA